MAELDDAYANAPYIKDSDTYVDRITAAAAAFRDSLGERAHLGIPYGDSERQAYDLFLPEGPPKGTLIFIHGGYWRAFHRHDNSHLAAGAVARGWAVALPSYDLCPDVRIADITRQIARAVETIAAATDGPITLAGHSAGGHLAARMLDRGLISQATADRIKVVIPISPLSDLLPFLKTTMNELFQMDADAARAESPILMKDRYDIPVVTWVGGAERPAFLDQAQWLTDAWGSDLVIVPGLDHFNIIDPLTDPESDMVRRLTA